VRNLFSGTVSRSVIEWVPPHPKLPAAVCAGWNRPVPYFNSYCASRQQVDEWADALLGRLSTELCRRAPCSQSVNTNATTPRTHFIDGWPKPHHHFRVGRNHPGTGKAQREVWVGSLAFPFAVSAALLFWSLALLARSTALPCKRKRTWRLDFACRNFNL
jgi:hypothetical protein